MNLGLRAVPRSMPHPHRWPVDDLAGHEPCVAQQPLPWSSSQLSARADATPRGRSSAAGTAPTGEGWSEQPPNDLPDPVASAVRLATVFLETMHGLRPVGQLNRWLDRPVLTVFAATVSARCRTAVRQTGKLRSVHLQRPAAAVVETVALFRSCGREEAMAFRLEARRQHWLCTAWQTHPAASG